MTVLRVIPGVGAAAWETDFCSVRVVCVIICCVSATRVTKIPVLLMEISWRWTCSVANILVGLMILRERPALAYAKNCTIVIVRMLVAVRTHHVAHVLVLDIVLCWRLVAVLVADEEVLHVIWMEIRAFFLTYIILVYVIFVFRSVRTNVITSMIFFYMVQITRQIARNVARYQALPVIPSMCWALFVANLFAFEIVLFGVRTFGDTIVCVIHVKFIISRICAAVVTFVVSLYKILIARCIT